MKNLLSNIVFLTLAGSKAYNTCTLESDTDLKGICLPPAEVRNHLFEKFSQAINSPEIESKYGHLRNPLNPKFESTVYSLEKFFQLAAAVNPNIIELLWVSPEHIVEKNKIGEKLLENRELFLSTKARASFSGYAFAQAAKIERHRKWIVKGEIPKPLRSNYGLPEKEPVLFGDVERAIKAEVNLWDLNDLELDPERKESIKERVWDIIYNVSKFKLNGGNWPAEYSKVICNRITEDFKLDSDLSNYLKKEVEFKNAVKEYNSWVNWKENRNKERKVYEEKAGYDLKHASHLIRLSRMGLEILEGKGVITKRPDAGDLLAIRRGERSYESIMEEFAEINSKIDLAYKTTKLPKSVNYVKINELYQSLINL